MEHLLSEPTTCRDGYHGRVHCNPGSRQRQETGRAITSLVGKELELVWQVEWYQLIIVGPTPTHYSGSRTRLIERGWTRFFSGVVPGERRRVGIFTSRWPSSSVLEFSAVNERVAAMQLHPEWCFVIACHGWAMFEH